MAVGAVGIYLMMGAWMGYRFTCMSIQFEVNNGTDD
jgi:hypothetical protein